MLEVRNLTDSERIILSKHSAWLQRQPYGECANLARTNLAYAKLSHVNLAYAKLSHVNLAYANLSYANLAYANLSYANLAYANLTCANLANTDLSYANLDHADLANANLFCTNLTHANLDHANLSHVNLAYTDLSRVIGLLDAATWLIEHFKSDTDGIFVYKAISMTAYKSPDHWEIKPGSFLTEICHPDRSITCACGVNFATEAWCRRTYPRSQVWLCRIYWPDLAGIVVPFNTDGKARCSRLELLEQVKL